MSYDELVKKVLAAMEAVDDYYLNVSHAAVAIAVVLEAAARVADNHGHEENLDCCGCGEEIAAAIRTLKDNNSA